MKQRCHNPKNPGYKRYGARGIQVCERWRNSFSAFLEDMGPRPPGTTIDRINGKLSYEPSNCRWATRKEQSWNREPVIWVEHQGQQVPATVFAQRAGVGPRQLRKVMSRDGLDPHEARQYVETHTRPAFRNRLLTVQGETMAISEACRRYGISRGTVTDRLKFGWPDEEAVLTPPDPRRKKRRKP